MKQPTQWKTNRGTDVATDANDGFELLLETGFHLLLQTGGDILLEPSVITPKPATVWVEL